MKIYLITLSLVALTLYVFVKQSYKRATMQDEVDASIDYESDKYKEAEAFFIRMGRV